MNHKNLIIYILLGFYGLYFCLSTGVNSSNDGGHFGLAKAIFYDHQVEVGRYVNTYVFEPDYAVKDGKIYSDRLPGMATLIIPSFAYAKLLSFFGVQSTCTESIDVIVASLLPPLFGVLSMFLLYFFCVKLFGVDPKISLLTVVLYGLCTLSMLESTHLYSHGPSLFFVSLSIFVAVASRSNNWKKNLVLSSILIGFSSLIELQNILYSVPIFIYVVQKNNLLKEGYSWMIPGVIFGGICLFFLGMLFLYNYITFEEFFLKSNKYNPFFPEEASFLTSLSGDFFNGLDRLYTSFQDIDLYINPHRARLNNIPGLFITSPIFIFSMIGFVKFYKSYKIEFYLFLSIILIATVVAAMHITTLVRHIYTVNMITFIPIIFYFQSLVKSNNRKFKYIQIGILSIIGLISFVRVSFSSISYWGRYIDDIFLFSKEYKLFFIANLPLFIIMYWKRKWINSFFSY